MSRNPLVNSADGYFHPTPETIHGALWPSPEEVIHAQAWRPGDFFLGYAMGPEKVPVAAEGDGHILLCAGTGGGKGQRILVNNLALWEGPLVVFDPKGAMASMMAVRRGTEPNPYCEPMGRPTYVFDPFDKVEYSDDPAIHQRLKDAYRATINPLDMVDLEDDPISMLETYAKVMVEGKSTDDYWENEAIPLIACILLYVLVAPQFEGRRNLNTFYNLLMMGEQDLAEAVKVAGGAMENVDATMWLFSAMMNCDEFMGYMQRYGNYFSNLYEKAEKQWSGILGKAASSMRWLNNQHVQKSIETSSFRFRDLKTDPRGVSIFINIRQEAMAAQRNLMRLMVEAFNWDTSTGKKPASGKQILCVIDEFLGLGRMSTVDQMLRQKREEGVRFLIVIQDFDSLETEYGKSWTCVPGACETQIFYHLTSSVTKKQVSELVGNSYQVMLTKTVGVGASKTGTDTSAVSGGTSDTMTSSHTKNQSEGGGTTLTESNGKTTSENETWQNGNSLATGTNTAKTKAIGTSNSTGGGTNESVSTGVNGGEGTSASKNSSENVGASNSSNRGFSHPHKSWFGLFPHKSKPGTGDTVNVGTGTQLSVGSSVSDGFTKSSNSGWGRTDAHGNSLSWTTQANRTDSETDGTQVTATASESVGGSKGVGTSTSQSLANAINWTKGASDTTGKSHTEQAGWSESHAEAVGMNVNYSVQESIQKVPLLPFEEMHKIDKIKRKDDPLYPGVAVVKVPGMPSFPVHLTIYYEDDRFYRKFGKDRMHPFQQTPLPWRAAFNNYGPRLFELENRRIEEQKRLRIRQNIDQQFYKTAYIKAQLQPLVRGYIERESARQREREEAARRKKQEALEAERCSRELHALREALRVHDEKVACIEKRLQTLEYSLFLYRSWVERTYKECSAVKCHVWVYEGGPVRKGDPIAMVSRKKPWIKSWTWRPGKKPIRKGAVLMVAPFDAQEVSVTVEKHRITYNLKPTSSAAHKLAFWNMTTGHPYDPAQLTAQRLEFLRGLPMCPPHVVEGWALAPMHALT